jgi:hypothetical protein
VVEVGMSVADLHRGNSGGRAMLMAIRRASSWQHHLLQPGLTN